MVPVAREPLLLLNLMDEQKCAICPEMLTSAGPWIGLWISNYPFLGVRRCCRHKVILFGSSAGVIRRCLVAG